MMHAYRFTTGMSIAVLVAAGLLESSGKTAFAAASPLRRRVASGKKDFEWSRKLNETANYVTISPTHPPTALTGNTFPTTSPTNYPSISIIIVSLIESSPPLLSTASPSANPIVKPTTSPSKVPVTREPSSKPSDKPPTIDPTRQPTIDPTQSPITESTTNQPSQKPSKLPTPTPTMSPTTMPTPLPTKKPSQKPSNKPSRLPTDYPTNSPIVKPSVSPINGPSESPSRRPTKKPSNKPTVEASRPPTASPSLPPTFRPSHRPTDTPSRKPTRHPTVAPTITLPTNKPSVQPTRHPTLAPSTSLPTNKPSVQPTGRPTSDPTTSLPTNKPSVQPTRHSTLAPSTSLPTNKPSVQPTKSPLSVPTNKPSRRPSPSPSRFPASTSPSNRPTQTPTYSSTPWPSRMPSIKPTLVTLTPSVLSTTQSPSSSPSERLTGHTIIPSYEPSAAYIILSGVLNFNLPLRKVMTDNSSISSFEETIEKFLQQKLNGSNGISTASSNGLLITNYNVTVISQEVIENTSRRRRLQDIAPNDYNLIVTTLITALGMPAIFASKFPFQAEAHSVITNNRDELFQELYASTLKQLEETPPPDEMKDMDISSVSNRNEGGNLKTIAMGSSVAGAIVLLSLLAVLITHRRSENAFVTTDNDDLPPTSFANTSGKLDDEISSIDDSLLSAGYASATYPKNIPHYVPESKIQSIDQEVVDDVFPVEHRVVAEGTAHAESPGHKASEHEKDEVATAEKNSKYTPSSEVEEHDSAKKVFDEYEGGKLDDFDPHERLCDMAILEEDEDLNSNEGTMPVILKAPKPASKGFNWFSCFADNTFEENPMSTTQKAYRSDNTPKATNITRARRIYNVRAPPGPLGIVIDRSNDGPFVHDIKALSPLNGLVQKGDIILSIDGWNCKNKDGSDVAEWIRTKPNKGEQVLTLMGSHLWDDATLDEEGSV